MTTRNSKTTKTAKRKEWTLQQVRMLKQLARKKSAKTIARQVGHTESATRQKAHSIGVSLALAA